MTDKAADKRQLRLRNGLVTRHAYSVTGLARVRGQPGRKLQLECSVAAFPRPELSWHFLPSRDSPARRVHTGERFTQV